LQAGGHRRRCPAQQPKIVHAVRKSSKIPG
jgi:hypothetical protein